MARNCILDYAPEDTNTDTEAPNDNFNDEKIRLYNEKYIDFLVNNYKIDKERLLQSLNYEDVTIEDIHYELRENIDRITIKEDWQITANLELLMDNYNMELCIGENKRFKLKIKDLYFEVDNLVEMLDKAIPFIQKQVSEITILVLKRFGKIPKDENIDLTNTSIKDLFEIFNALGEYQNKEKESYLIESQYRIGEVLRYNGMSLTIVEIRKTKKDMLYICEDNHGVEYTLSLKDHYALLNQKGTIHQG